MRSCHSTAKSGIVPENNRKVEAMRAYMMFPIYCLACYRLSIMLASDKGPYFIFTRLRSWLKREAKENKPVRESKIHVGIACPLCTSVWVAFPIAAYAYFHKQLHVDVSACGDIFLSAMALSAVAILMNRALPPKP